MERLSTTQCLLHWIQRTPYAVAVIENGHPYSYGDLGVSVVQYVKALQALPAHPGMLMGIACQNRYLHLAVLLAAEIVGVTAAPLSAAEIRADDPVVARCDLLGLDQPALNPRVVPVLPLNQRTIDRVARTPVTGADFALLDHCPSDDTVVLLSRTSGSTGRPKVMAMTHAQLRDLTAKTIRHPDDPDYAWNFLNLYGFTLRSAYRESTIALRLGRTVVSSQLWSLLADMDRFAQFRTTLVSGDAVRLTGMLPAAWRGPRTGVITVKGGALPATTRHLLRERVATHVYHTYATIEVHRIATIDATGVGILPADVSVRIMTVDGREAAPGETGVIEVRSGMMVDRYLWDEEATKAAFHNGWYRTNDLGSIPEPGRLRLLGRADDMVNVGGIKFVPQPVEQQIRDLEGIEDAILITVPAPDGQEVLYLALQSTDPAVFQRCQDAIAAILTGPLRPFVPVVLATLPRTDTGKVRRDVLKRQLAVSRPG